MKRLEALEEQAAIPPRVHTIWRNEDEGDADIEAARAALLASGRARQTDKFLAVGWRGGGPELPVGPDRWDNAT